MTQPTPRPMGRPRLPNARRITLGVRVTEAERAAMEAAASKAGASLSVWAREALIRGAAPCAT